MKKETKADRRKYQWHKNSMAFLRAIVTPFICRIFRYSFESDLDKIEGPYLILANHTINLDPALVGVAFKKHMYFVASEHLLRKGFASKLLQFFLPIISRTKGKTDAQTVINMIQALKTGKNVCMFPEGNRSFSGKTGLIYDVTGKVVKKAGVKLITFRIDGGYFTEPRWAFSIRKGKSVGRVMNIYSPQQIEALSVDEINTAIRKDLYVDAYAVQEKNPIAFKGKDLTKGLETAMFTCPKCKEIGTLVSHKDYISCNACDYKVQYTPDGQLLGALPHALTLTSWDTWQKEELQRKFEMAKLTGLPLFSDANALFFHVNNRHKERDKKRGMLVAYSDRLTLDSQVLLFDDIPSFGIYARNSLVFTYKDEHCEIRLPKLASGLKYHYLFDLVKREE